MLPPRRNAPARPRIMVALDPSIAAFGWAILAIDPTPRVLASGCIRTAVDDEDAYVFEQDGARIDEIAIALLSVLDHAQRLGDVTVGYEVPGGSKSARAIKMLAYSFTIVRTALVVARLRSIPLPARTVKLELTGDPEAEKDVVADCVHKAIGWRPDGATKAENEARSDAAAVGVVAARRLRSAA